MLQHTISKVKATCSTPRYLLLLAASRWPLHPMKRLAVHLQDTNTRLRSSDMMHQILWRDSSSGAEQQRQNSPTELWCRTTCQDTRPLNHLSQALPRLGGLGPAAAHQRPSTSTMGSCQHSQSAAFE